MTLDPTQFLPPGVTPFEVILYPGGQIDIRGFEQEDEAMQVVQALQTTPLTARREDTQLWRVRGLMMQGQAQLYEFAVSDDNGQTYQDREFPEMPGVAVHGNAAEPNTFDALHYREGRIDLEPEAPDDLLEVLEETVHAYHGTASGGPDQWEAQHVAAGGDAAQIPEARRVKLRLQDTAEGLRFVPVPETAEYLLGSAWHPYAASALPAVADDDETGSPFDLLSSLFDMKSVQAEIYDDGRVELQADGVDDSTSEIIKFTLRDLLGAGDRDEWNQKVGELFELPEGQDRPKAIRAALLRQMIDADPNLAGQAMQPVAVSYDGEIWLELDEEDEDEE